jgi:hypothetical protein
MQLVYMHRKFHSKIYFQGFEKTFTDQNKRWIRLASLYPERIDYVEFYRNGVIFDIAYEEPYYTLHKTTWIQDGVELTGSDEEWRVEVHLHSGEIIEKFASVIM